MCKRLQDETSAFSLLDCFECKSLSVAMLNIKLDNYYWCFYYCTKHFNWFSISERSLELV